MSEEGSKFEEESTEEEPLTAEDLAQVTGGAAEATQKSFYREEAEN